MSFIGPKSRRVRRYRAQNYARFMQITKLRGFYRA